MAVTSYDELARLLVECGVTQVLFKQLSENDNTKQQIYLGGSFEILNEIPFDTVKSDASARRPNFKARVPFAWINDEGEISDAPHAKLILYPKYPEVRLSGFLRDCPTAPSVYLQPVPKERRSGGRDGRLLILGIKPGQKVVAYLSPPQSPVSRSLANSGNVDTRNAGSLQRLSLPQFSDNRARLLSAMSDIVADGWHHACRLDKSGRIIEYNATNAAGYTLEALLGVVPNGIPGPDLLGWEVKSFSDPRITLMTPEPDGGFYGEQGVRAFLMRYGRWRDGVTKYFTGIHRAGAINGTTNMTLSVDGFDPDTGTITDPGGGIFLNSHESELAAFWSFSRLLDHWGRKHSNALYVRYSVDKTTSRLQYRYDPNVYLGVGTDFSLFLQALVEGAIVYDPAPKAWKTSDMAWKTKARSQFRISFNRLPDLYHYFEEVTLSGSSASS